MAIDLDRNGNFEEFLAIKKKSEMNKKVAVLSRTTKIIVTEDNYKKSYLYDRFKKFFGRMPDEKEKMFIMKNNVRLNENKTKRKQ